MITGERRLVSTVIASLITLSFMLADPLYATDPLVLTDSQDEYALGLHLDLLPDPQAQYTIAEVSSPSFAALFVSSADTAIFVDNDNRAIWMRLMLQNDTAETNHFIAVLKIHGADVFEVYIPNSSAAEGWVVKKANDLTPFVQREVKYRHLAHRLPLEPGQTRIFYLHLSDVVDRISSPNFIALWSEAAFAIHDHDERILLGIYYGIICVMMLYNLFVFFSLRDRAYLYYVCSMFFACLWFVFYNGIASEYLLPNGLFPSGWNYHRSNTLIVSVTWVFMLIFVRTFLHTQIYAPRIHRLLALLIAVNLLFAGIVLVDRYEPILPLSYLLISIKWIVVLATGVIVWRQGFRAARYFLVAWVAYLIGGFLLTASALNLVPITFITRNSIQIGHALEAILLSLALADRINILREEKEQEEETSRQAELRAHTAELQAQAVEKELQTAQNLQMGLMPSTPPQIPGFDVAGCCLPATQVGGDFFQYFRQNGTLSICLADVTGHAMEAAVPVMMFSGVLETEMQYGHSVDRLLAQLNHLLHRKLDRRTFVCFTIGEVDLSSKNVRLANGGCPYPFHYRATTGTVAELPVEAYPLGVREETSYPVIEAQLAPGDRLVFCSDGLVEAQNGQEEMFGFEPLAETIRQGCAEGLSSAALIDRLIGAVKSFAGTAPQGDDMTCVVLRVGDNLL